MKLKSILTNTNISFHTRLRCTKCNDWSIFMYGCDTWILNCQTEKKISAFEMWTYRRMEKISWTARKTNIEVLELANIKSMELLKTIKARKLSYFGHIRRHNSLEKFILEGKIEGKILRGRKRKSWTDNIKAMTGMTMQESNEAAMDRERWKTMTSNLWKEKEPR